MENTSSLPLTLPSLTSTRTPHFLWLWIGQWGTIVYTNQTIVYVTRREMVTFVSALLVFWETLISLVAVKILMNARNLIIVLQKQNASKFLGATIVLAHADMKEMEKPMEQDANLRLAA